MFEHVWLCAMLQDIFSPCSELWTIPIRCRLFSMDCSAFLHNSFLEPSGSALWFFTALNPILKFLARCFWQEQNNLSFLPFPLFWHRNSTSHWLWKLLLSERGLSALLMKCALIYSSPHPPPPPSYVRHSLLLALNFAFHSSICSHILLIHWNLWLI